MDKAAEDIHGVTPHMGAKYGCILDDETQGSQQLWGVNQIPKDSVKSTSIVLHYMIDEPEQPTEGLLLEIRNLIID